MIMAELDKRGKGYNDEHILLKPLFFADDALMLSHSLKDAKDYGLENKFRKELCDDI